MGKELNEKMVKDRGFVVEEFMVRDLQLTGLELMVYAVIYSDCKDGGTYTGSIESLAERINATMKTAYDALNSLIGKGLIIKAQAICFDAIYHEYKAVHPSELDNAITELDVRDGDTINQKSVYALLSNILKHTEKRVDDELTVLFSGWSRISLTETWLSISNHQRYGYAFHRIAYDRIDRIYIEYEDCEEPLGLVIELDDRSAVVLADKHTILLAEDKEEAE